jgi:hypothetical protein
MKLDTDIYNYDGNLITKGYNEWEIAYGNWKITYRCNSAAYTCSETITTHDTNWHFYVITVDTSYITIYFDSNLLKQTSITGFSEFNNANYNFGVGKNQYNVGTDGCFDEIAIWSSTFTAAEVSDLYNSNNGLYVTLSGTLPSTGRILGDNLMQLYHFDDNSTTVRDSSVNGNDMSMTNMEANPWVAGKIIKP